MKRCTYIAESDTWLNNRNGMRRCFPRQKWLGECVTVSHYMYIACLVCTCFVCNGHTVNLCSFHKTLIHVFALSYYRGRLPTVKFISTSIIFSFITIFHLDLNFIFIPFVNFSHLLIRNCIFIRFILSTLLSLFSS